MNFLKRIFDGRKKETPELPPEFLQDEPPDWLLDLKGVGLPYGARFSVRVQLWNDSRQGTADVLVFPAKQDAEPQSAVAPMLRLEIDRLFVLLGFSFPEDIESVRSDVIDGCPVALSIHRHEPYVLKVAECNLAGWNDTKQSRPPVVEIGWLLLEMQKRILPIDEK